MTGFYGWAAFAALGFLTVIALVSRPEQIWSNAYALAICLAEVESVKSGRMVNVA